MAMRRVVDVLPQAIDEAREARNYYLSKSAAAEEAFRRELEHAVPREAKAGLLAFASQAVSKRASQRKKWAADSPRTGAGARD